MERINRTRSSRIGGAVLWSPWGPVPDPSCNGDGKVTRLHLAKAPCHKSSGFELKPRDSLTPRQ